MSELKERRASEIPGFRWILCNTCGKTAVGGAILFVSGCGHVHCSACLRNLASRTR
ncbi:unnamed protein product [Anisakis simplex]|uniref:Zf-C3HC4 domain-containing protein n=1 Tax=Anisakis simplex TaxID=6269 RepID=A0A0M3JKW7_ANISI|nr:unnamed protein product [Anisakis simplex]